MTPRKKLIEVALPLEAINAASAAREVDPARASARPCTSGGRGARSLPAGRCCLRSWSTTRPPGPSVFRPRRRRGPSASGCTTSIEPRLVGLWENSNNEAILNEARWYIARSLAWGRGEEPPPEKNPEAVRRYLLEHAPPVYDPFCGGGSIPLEAQRLGLRAYGSDLNPVAVMISKALVEFPPKFAGLPPVNPESRKKLANGGAWNAKGAQGLAEDVRYYGRWMRDEAEKRIGHLYPEVRITPELAQSRPDLKDLVGQQLTARVREWLRTAKWRAACRFETVQNQAVGRAPPVDLGKSRWGLFSMGGSQSGRWRWHDKGIAVEECLVLSIADLLRQQLVVPGRWTSGSLSWKRTGAAEPFATIGFEADITPAHAWMQLRYTASGNPVDYRVRLTSTRPNFGGLRWWFVCPLVRADGRPPGRVAKLYLPPGQVYFGRREAYGLTYTSCQESHDRLFRRLAAELGTSEATVRWALKRPGGLLS